RAHGVLPVELGLVAGRLRGIQYAPDCQLRQDDEDGQRDCEDRDGAAPQGPGVEPPGAAQGEGQEEYTEPGPGHGPGERPRLGRDVVAYGRRGGAGGPRACPDMTGPGDLDQRQTGRPEDEGERDDDVAAGRLLGPCGPQEGC